MIWKFRKQNGLFPKGLFPKGLNWVQHWVSRIGLFVTYEKSQYFYAKGFFKGVQRTLWSSIFLTLKIDVLQTRLYGHLLNIRTPHSYKPPHFSKEKSVHFPSLPVYSCLKLKLTYNAIVNRNALFETRWNWLYERLLNLRFWTFHYVRFQNRFEVNRTTGVRLLIVWLTTPGLCQPSFQQQHTSF